MQRIFVIMLLLLFVGCGGPIDQVPNNAAQKREGFNANQENDIRGQEYHNKKGIIIEEKLDYDITDPESVAFLVNKDFELPSDYKPTDLIYPNVPFIFDEKNEKRLLRREAARALEEMYSEAEKQGLSLVAVSGYRSYDVQKYLFDFYVNRDGEEKARTFSALPGQSEHQTGLAIDITSGDLKCVIVPCFSKTEESKWLEKHAQDFGFIIRYLDGKEGITGYIYEPWHLRYVGKELAKEITDLGITLEEYINLDTEKHK